MREHDVDSAKTVIADPPSEERRIAMSYQDWLNWEGSDRQSEWVDGEAIVFMPPTIPHADVAGFVYILLFHFARFFDLGRVMQAPVEVRLAPGVSREPDVLFVARRHLDRITHHRIDGAADLVVEVVSDDSVTRDRVKKYEEYAAAGIPEYWLFDPRPRRHEHAFFQLTTEGIYRSVPLDPDGRYRSSVLPGFWLRPDWLWQEPPPDPLHCLREIAPDAIASLLAD